MKLVNKTLWNSDDLRALFRAGMRDRGASHAVTVTVVYSRSGWVTGRASIGYQTSTGFKHGARIKMRLPAPWRTDHSPHKPGATLVEDVARVFMHELAHNLGARHRQMHPALNACTQDVPWAAGLQLRAVEEPKAVVDRAAALSTTVEKRALQAQRKVEDLERLITAKTKLLKKWRAKVRYYQKKGVLNSKSE